jgi:hypothetical protein
VSREIGAITAHVGALAPMKGPDVRSPRAQPPHGGAPDEPGAAEDEDPH